MFLILESWIEYSNWKGSSSHYTNDENHGLSKVLNSVTLCFTNRLSSLFSYRLLGHTYRGPVRTVTEWSSVDEENSTL